MLTQHEGVEQAAVVVREDRSGEKRLVAYVVSSNQEAESDTAQIRAYLQNKLPEYMVPGLFVFLKQLPLTPNGKLDYRALPAPGIQTQYVAPGTPDEEKMCQLWQQVLNLVRIGITSNFFDVGGHSLLATQLVSRIREAFAIELPLRALFEVPTITDLIKRIDDLKAQAVAAGNTDGVPTIQKELSLEQMLAGLESLSEEEIKALLSIEDPED